MKKLLNWQVFLGISLVALSVFFYLIHFFIFRDARHIFIYLIGDIAFVFIEVLLVTLILHQLLGYREKRSMLNKLNMVIGAFFSEVGLELLKLFSAFDPDASDITRRLIIGKDCSDREFLDIRRYLKNYKCGIDVKRGNLTGVKSLLREKRQFLLNLLENPNLLEHESFTNLLWAVFHLTEELVNRNDLTRLHDADIDHLAGDINRAYSQLISQWVDYLRHLKNDYPYLFSLAIRTNPFDANASVEFK